jgi:hypothetical protein
MCCFVNGDNYDYGDELVKDRTNKNNIYDEIEIKLNVLLATFISKFYA